ncbi:AAA family ATPase [Corallococcus exercitus]|uniref:AAA family ATPase n=1 Tax=Corallococcus exercitus TaxID=2316736 RepID=A0A7Y4KEJ5_9BACT|nr:AAA family ATPase [Corallococcus exercitus]NOK32350.1 AAA family ATPase [Corallococcus exercitus]
MTTNPQIELIVPRHNTAAPLKINISQGSSIVFIGANGSGKTRLGVHLETILPLKKAHRISAQKSLFFPDNTTLTSFEGATERLWFGTNGAPTANESFMRTMRLTSRWGGNPSTGSLNDFDALLQALFAEQSRIAIQHLPDRRQENSPPIPLPKLSTLKATWERLLPHRKILINETSINVIPAATEPRTGFSAPDPLAAPPATPYSAMQMSDGERAIFYYIGQCLLAPPNSALIIDEPENHIHKAILDRLWSELEAARQDCAFIYMTHDLDFATSHQAVARYYIRGYFPESGADAWEVDEIPEAGGIPDAIVAEIVGSRRPILFVEGQGTSLDRNIYQAQYPSFTVIPAGSCSDVIRSTGSFRRNGKLLRLGLAYGIVDADGRDEAEIDHLKSLSVFTLPVSEVENLLALPAIFLALADSFHCADPRSKLQSLTTDLLKMAQADLEAACCRYVTRAIDQRLKRVEVSSDTFSKLEVAFDVELKNINPRTMFEDFKSKLEAAIQNSNLYELLRIYDNKGIAARVAFHLGVGCKKELFDKFGRLINRDAGSVLRKELSTLLPAISL